MYNDYSIHNCTIPTTGFKLQGVLRGSKKKKPVLIIVLLDLRGLRMKNISLLFIVNFGNQLISHFFHLPSTAMWQPFLC